MAIREAGGDPLAVLTSVIQDQEQLTRATDIIKKYDKCAYTAAWQIKETIELSRALPERAKVENALNALEKYPALINKYDEYLGSTLVEKLRYAALDYPDRLDDIVSTFTKHEQVINKYEKSHRAARKVAACLWDAAVKQPDKIADLEATFEKYAHLIIEKHSGKDAIWCLNYATLKAPEMLENMVYIIEKDDYYLARHISTIAWLVPDKLNSTIAAIRQYDGESSEFILDRLALMATNGDFEYFDRAANAFYTYADTVNQYTGDAKQQALEYLSNITFRKENSEKLNNKDYITAEIKKRTELAQIIKPT